MNRKARLLTDVLRQRQLFYPTLLRSQYQPHVDQEDVLQPQAHRCPMDLQRMLPGHPADLRGLRGPQ